MMFTFQIKDVLPLLDHTEAAKKHRPLYGGDDTAVPGLWLVHDAGVYLMSNGDPGLMKDPSDPKSMHQVVYAMGFGPETYLGGDDFGELLKADWVWTVIKRARAKNISTFSVLLTDAAIELRV